MKVNRSRTSRPTATRLSTPVSACTRTSASERLIVLTQKWWFYLIIALLTFLPAYTAKPYDSRESAGVVIAVLSNAMVYSWKALLPVFKILPLLIFGMLAVWKDKATRVFYCYGALVFLITGLFENMAITSEYGFAALIGNMVICLIIAAAWLWEAITKHSDFNRVQPSFSRLWVMPLAFMAFWYPVNMDTLQPDFGLHYLITSEAGLTFCMMLPVYLSVMLLFFPDVNLVTLRISSFAGVLIGLLSMMQFFVFNKGMEWMGILHLPLLIISSYAFVLSFRKRCR
ncbi:MAG TPA: hypothetical protein DCY84_10760 [Firmicutes bacterium]|nr:hypothetical protein [Bacillota bacterium]HAZ22828.1 hypothetical protein [Bacillota bacterium]HBR23777.1 hypothetical protein [Bacillota bacterium]HCF89694.1 hypothetical protein [Bacillota bacterium]HCT37472.1 hypothetical protein [Bacillota bacterium]